MPVRSTIIIVVNLRFLRARAIPASSLVSDRLTFGGNVSLTVDLIIQSHINDYNYDKAFYIMP